MEKLEEIVAEGVAKGIMVRKIWGALGVGALIGATIEAAESDGDGFTNKLVPD